MTKKKFNIVKYIVYLLICSFLPNMIGAAFIMLYFRYLNLTSITLELAGQITAYSFTPDIIITATIFLLIIAVALIRVFKIVQLLVRYSKSETTEEEVLLLKNKILNLPSFINRLIFTGWFLSATAITVSMHFKGMSLLNKFYFFFLIFFVAGSLAFVISYYLIDNIFRIFIVKIFPDGDFSQVGDVRHIHINLRMLIAFWIGGILPIFMIIIFSKNYIDLINAGTNNPDLFYKYISSVIFSLALSIFMTFISSFYFSRTIGKPLISLEDGMKQIREGNFDVTLSVNQKDEIGNVFSGFNEMAKGLLEREKIKDVFGKFVSSDIRDEILEGDLELGGKKSNATILFCDIRNFTSISETLEASEVVNFLNTYFNEMVKPVLDNGGVLDKYIGDALMAIFGPPADISDHVVKALKSALTMKEKLFHFNELRKNFNQEEISIGIGINTGDIVAGTIGSSERMEYTVIGDAVNIASRVENLTKNYGVEIIITESTVNGLPENHSFNIRYLNQVKVRGRKEPFKIFELVS